MKKLIIIIFLTLNFCGFSQTQNELNNQSHSNFEKVDKEMKNIYQKILIEYKSDTTFVENLKVSQKIWIKLRDAELKTKYPKREHGYYGSIQPMCENSYLKELTEKRIESLKVWIDGIKEGNVCFGSVKLN